MPDSSSAPRRPPSSRRRSASGRRRGAQPGNSNAFKHGIYSTRFLPAERKVLGEIPVTDLQGEIDALRAFLLRYIETESRSPQVDEQASRISLLTVCFAASQLAAMVRVQSRSRRYLTESHEVEQWAALLPAEEDTSGPGGS